MMKKLTMLASVLLVLAMVFPAVAEEDPWTDGAMVLEGASCTLYLPEGMVNTTPTEEEFAAAKTEVYDEKNGGLYIGVGLVQGTTLEEILEADFEALQEEWTKEYGSKALFPDATSSRSDMWMMMQIAGESGSYLYRGRTDFYGDKVYYLSTKFMNRGKETGMMLCVYLPAGENVYRLTYIIANEYMDEPGNLIYGTLEPN